MRDSSAQPLREERVSIRSDRIGHSFALALLVLVCAVLPSCSGGSSPSVTQPPVQPVTAVLTSADVQDIVSRTAASVDTPMVIAVTDRAGRILGIFRKTGAATTAVGNFSQTVDANELAVSLARTASFFSNDQAPLSSRTVRFISGVHFPPGISFTANAALYGIENTNRGCTLSTNYIPGQAIPPATNIAGSGPGLGVITGKADVDDSDPTAVNPGGVPIFKNGRVAGGVGVVAGADGSLHDVAEFAAFTGAIGNGFGPNVAPPGVVVIDGVSLPFVDNASRPAGFTAGTATGSYLMGPTASAGEVPDGDLVAPTNGPVGGLTAAEVRQILDLAVQTANQTRAVIRLPLGSRARMAIAVADLDGTIIGMVRMPDATVFSVDVAASKARNMIYFNSASRTAQDLNQVPMGTAVTNRTISFGAQPFFPPGIDDSGDGPFFNLYVQDTFNPCTQGFQPPGPNQSGIVFFPGAVGLYRNGVLVGGLGISGDGVEQDDFVTSGAAVGFEAPVEIRADQLELPSTTSGMVRLPYLKFPRNPTD